MKLSTKKIEWLTAIALVLGIGLRLTLAYAFVGNTDQQSWETVVEIMRRGGNNWLYSGNPITAISRNQAV
jgi:hypothetical protein